MIVFDRCIRPNFKLSDEDREKFKKLHEDLNSIIYEFTILEKKLDDKLNCCCTVKPELFASALRFNAIVDSIMDIRKKFLENNGVTDGYIRPRFNCPYKNRFNRCMLDR